MPWTKMVSMELDDEDKLDLAVPSISQKPDYPWGLRICFCEKELKKLELDVPEIGDMIDMRAMGTVTSVSIEKRDGGDSCRVEIQIERIALENEAKE
jgi:hypothetical protein